MRYLMETIVVHVQGKSSGNEVPLFEGFRDFSTTFPRWRLVHSDVSKPSCLQVVCGWPKVAMKVKKQTVI